MGNFFLAIRFLLLYIVIRRWIMEPMQAKRQSSDTWLDPVSKSRITCHNITWIRSAAFQCIQAGGDIYFDQIPRTGTMPHAHDFIEILVAVHGGARGSRGKSVLPCASMRTTVPLNLDHVRRLSVSD